MLDLVNDERDFGLGLSTKPDSGTFNSILRAFANDSNDKTVFKAEEILEIIKGLGVPFDLQIYDSILRCCANSRSIDENDKSHAVRVASDVLLKIRESAVVSPDRYTFKSFYKRMRSPLYSRR